MNKLDCLAGYCCWSHTKRSWRAPSNWNQAPVFEEISQTLRTNKKQGQIYNKYMLSTDKSQACLAFGV